MSSLLTRLATGVRAADPHQRAPKAATGNVYYSTPGMPQVPLWDGVSAIRNGYEASVYVMRCARATAEKLAGVPWRAGQDPDTPAQFNPAAPLAKLLGPAKPSSPGGPNPQWSARSLWIWSIVQRLITGRMAWETLAAPGSDRVAALWPLVAPFVQPVPSSNGSARYFDGYVYQLPTGQVPYQPDQLFYSYRPSQLDPRQPESVLQAAALPVSLQVALERYLWALAKNGMVGRTLVVTPPFEESGDRLAFQDQFEAEFTGYDNAGKTLFAELDDDELSPRVSAAGAAARQSVQAIKLDTSPTDAQVLELSRDMRQVIRDAFGVPRSKISDATDSTYANAAQDDLNWMYDRVIPLGHELADDVNLELAPRVGQDAGWFDFTAELQRLERLADAGATARTTIPVGAPQPPAIEPAPAAVGAAADAAGQLARAVADGLAGLRATEAKPTGPTAGGLVVKALDTGRVLMLQRALTADDPAAGTWEFPGGCLDRGEDPLAGAIREWMEETGAALPPGRVAASWTSPNGVYRGFVYLVPSEASVPVNVDHEDRHVLNPDDPDGDEIEVVAWWNPATLPGMTALRPECRQTPWETIALAGENDDRAAGKAEHPASTERLMEYWAHGEGAAKIRWGESGDFDRCRRHLGKHVRPDEVDGLCANLHHRATGAWPGHAPSEQSPGRRGEPVTEGGSAGLLLPVGGGPARHVFVPSGSDRRACGVCGQRVTAAVHHGTGRPPGRAGRRGQEAVAAALHAAGARHAGQGHHRTPTGHLARLATRTRQQVDAHAATLEPQLTQVLRGLFARQRKATLDRLTGRRGQRMIRAAQPPDGEQPERPVVIDATAVFDLAHWAGETRAALNPIHAAATALTTARMGADLHPGEGTPYETAAGAARAAMDTRASKLADTVTRTTYDQVSRTLAEGVAAGEHVRQLARRVGQVFDDADSARAKTIARTEVIGSLNAAADAYAAALPMGLVARKEWLATPDQRTRPNHHDANGQQRQVGEPFMVGGYPMSCPGDITAPASQVIDCRCTTLYVPARAARPAPAPAAAAA